MKLVFLAICFSFAASDASAALCSKAPAGAPCTPDPGEKTNRKKKEILEHISDAQSLNRKVEELKAAYMAVRGKSRSSDENEKEYLACEQYRVKKMAQDDLYKKAIDKTALLYHVGPINESLTIGKPDDSSIDYVAGLSAVWNPQVTDSGPGVYLAVKVKGADGLSYISGAASMDPKKPKGIAGLTLEDGRVLILKGTFDIAFENGNPGILARVLYHESRHFNRLSRASPDGSLARRGWASPEEEEKIAYEADVAMVSAFGLNESQIKAMKKQRDKFVQAVQDKKLSSRAIDPEQEKLWRFYYWERQLNLEHEYANLKHIADKARQEQLNKQRLEREERDRLAREEQQRLAREAGQAKEDRLARERAELAAIQERDSAAATCGYRPAYQGNTGKFLGFEDDHNYLFFTMPLRVPINMNDLRVAFLVARACEDVKSQATPIACNDAARILARHAAQGDFAAKLDYMLGLKERRGDCINHIFDEASSITDSSSFEKVMSKYHKRKKKERREHDKRWRSSPPRSDKPGRDRPPRDSDRTPADPDHDDVRRRIGGPFKP